MEPLRVLIVDDEQGMRMAVRRALRHFTAGLPEINGEVSFEVSEAGTGEEAITIINETTPNIILLDFKLPGISGLDVLDKIDSVSSDMLIIMITAYASIKTAVKATKSGAYDFLPKPFTPDELKSVIKKAAGRLMLMRQARLLAEEKKKIRFQFTSVLVHELKAPLAAVEGFLQIMQNHMLGDDVKTYDEIIERSSIRLGGMRKLIADILEMTHIESGEKKREFSEVDIVEIAQNSIETAQPEADARSIGITLHNSAPVTMTADKGEIEIILNNLVTNAVKYNKDNGKVDITISQSENRFDITVSDTGIGLSEEEAGKLFNEFVRIKNQKTRNILGSGLGLSTVKKLALLYGGDVSVSSAPDAGSTFKVTLIRKQQIGQE
jgi:two-component system, sensor histidine kinase and response regulator